MQRVKWFCVEDGVVNENPPPKKKTLFELLGNQYSLFSKD